MVAPESVGENMKLYHEIDGKKFYMGCNRDPDHDDGRRLLSIKEMEALPASVILNDKTPIEDQGNEGSCTSFAWNGAQMVRDFLVSGQYMVGAHQQFYRCETAADGNPGQDVGSSLSQGANIYKTVGFAPESIYPYSTPLTNAVPQSVLDAAKKDEGTVLTRLDATDENVTIANIKAALNSQYPVALGFTVFESFFNTGGDGNMPAPSGGVAGGHAVCCVGYDDNHTGNYDGSTGAFKFRNSWGTGWGAEGYWYMPYTYPLNSDDGVGDCWACISENDYPVPPPPTGTVTVASSPAAVNEALFVAGSDKALWYEPHVTTVWGPWQSLGGTLTSAPAVASLTGVREDVLVRGSDGGLWQRSFVNGNWVGWNNLGGQSLAGTNPTGYWMNANEFVVMVIGTDGAVWEKVWNGTSWSAWASLGKTIQ